MTTWLYWLSHPRQTVLIWVCSGTDNTFWLCPLSVHTSLCPLSSSSSSCLYLLYFIPSSVFHLQFLQWPSSSCLFSILTYFLWSVGLPPPPPADQCDICNLSLYNLCGVCYCISHVLHAISGFCCSVGEVFAFLSWFTACTGSCLRMFRGSIDYLTLEGGISRLSWNDGKLLATYVAWQPRRVKTWVSYHWWCNRHFPHGITVITQFSFCCIMKFYRVEHKWAYFTPQFVILPCNRILQTVL